MNFAHAQTAVTEAAAPNEPKPESFLQRYRGAIALSVIPYQQASADYSSEKWNGPEEFASEDGSTSWGGITAGAEFKPNLNRNGWVVTAAVSAGPTQRISMEPVQSGSRNLEYSDGYFVLVGYQWWRLYCALGPDFPLNNKSTWEEDYDVNSSMGFRMVAGFDLSRHFAAEAFYSEKYFSVETKSSVGYPHNKYEVINQVFGASLKGSIF